MLGCSEDLSRECVLSHVNDSCLIILGLPLDYICIKIISGCALRNKAAGALPLLNLKDYLRRSAVGAHMSHPISIVVTYLRGSDSAARSDGSGVLMHIPNRKHPKSQWLACCIPPGFSVFGQFVHAPGLPCSLIKS